MQTITFNKGLSRVEALKVLSKMFEKNIIPSEETGGDITVEALYDATFEDALKAVCGSAHTYVIKDNLIYVYHVDESQDNIRERN